MKKTYEAPMVEKLEFDYAQTIVASGGNDDYGHGHGHGHGHGRGDNGHGRGCDRDRDFWWD